MSTVWIVVADEATARILCRTDDGAHLQDVELLTDAAAHARNAKLRRDALGRRAPTGAQGDMAGNVTAWAGSDELRKEAELFARRVADLLLHALNSRRFGELHLVAAPRFLGLLRGTLDQRVAQCVVASLDKDLVHLSKEQIAPRVLAQVGEPH